MKRPDENLRDVFDRLMPPAAPGALDDAAARVLRQLREGRHHAAIKEQPAVSRLRSRFHFSVAAAVLIGMVAIGLYAAQRSGLLSAFLSTQNTNAPRVAPSAETETISLSPVPVPEPRPASSASSTRALVGESKGPSRTAAEEIAFLQSTDSGAGVLRFAAASVRRAAIDNHEPGTFNCGGVDGQLFPSTQAVPAPQGRCTAEKQTLDSIIAFAFQVSRSDPWSGPQQTVVGIPETLLQAPYFQIHAVAENPSGVTKAELRQMFQTLLIDRFKLKFRREIRQVDGYVLTVAKSGIKFKETSEPEGRVLGTGPNAIVGRVSMETIARNLETFFLPSIEGTSLMRPVGGPQLRIVPVDDKTGLKGVYEIRVNIRRSQVPAAGGGGGRNSAGLGSRMEYDPPLPKAFEEQLGLVLTRGKVPVEYIVVEHIELPSEN